MVSSKDLGPSTSPFFPHIFLKNQFRTNPQYPPESTDLSEKIAIITGGNAGLGFESACQLLSFKLSRLILAVRSTSKGEAAASRLRSQYPHATIEVWSLEMSSYESIQSFAKRVDTHLPRLDIAILNAGLRKTEFETVASTGHEEVIQVNYTSTIFLTILLLPILKRKSPPETPGRLTIVNSGLALAAKFTNRSADPLLPSFDHPKGYDGHEVYCTSKLLAHMFLYKLVDYVSSDDVIVNLADPGYVKGTGLHREDSGLLRVVFKVFEVLMGRSMQDGASTYLDAAVVKGKESHGCFLLGWQIQP